MVDTTRAEPDDEWNNSWIVLNPGTANPIWRRVTDAGGWVTNTGTFTITGNWPSSLPNGPAAGTPYEIFKVYRPENWLQAINYALTKSYPRRHRPASVEIPQNPKSRILDYGRLAKEVNTLANPTGAVTVTELADGGGAFQAGTYTFTYTFFNDFGETLAAPTSTVTIVGPNSRIDVPTISNVPAGAWGANFYCSVQPGDTTLDMLNVGDATIIVPSDQSTLNRPAITVVSPGQNINGKIWELQFQTPNPWYGIAPPSYNTTNVDFFRLHQIQKRMNPGGFPEVWNLLDPSWYKPLGGTTIQLAAIPTPGFNLKLIMTTTMPTVATDTDSTQEPTEMIMEGAEAYLWALLTKTSTIVNVNWKQLHDVSWAQYLKHCSEYAMVVPREFVYVPPIQVQY